MSNHLIPELIKDMRKKLLASRPGSSENNMLYDRIKAIQDYCEKALIDDKYRK